MSTFHPLFTPPQVRALTTICASTLPSADLSTVLEPALTELTGFLRKANRMLRQASLVALEVRRGDEGWGGGIECCRWMIRWMIWELETAHLNVKSV